MRKYIGFLPTPNVPIPAGVAPNNNYLGAAEPDPVKSHVWGGRVDYNLSAANRFFFRGSGSHFLENAEDWTYENPESNYLHALYRLRKTWSYTGNWTHVRGNTVLDAQLSGNFFSEGDQRLGLKRFKPSELGLPAYVDDFCGARRGGCQMPQVQTAGYRTFGNDVGTFGSARNIQGQFNVTQVRGAHTLRAGTDNRQHRRNIDNAGNTSPVLMFNNTYTRAADDTTVFPAQNLGLSWAAFMLGIPELRVDRRQRRAAGAVDATTRPTRRTPGASAPERHPQSRAALRVRDRHQRDRRPQHHRLRSRRQCWRSPRWPRRRTRRTRFPSARPARSSSAADRCSRRIPASPASRGRGSRCGCLARRWPGG